MDDDRVYLFCEYMCVVEGFNLVWVVLENVIGILLVGGGIVVFVIKIEFEKFGYEIDM